MTVLAIAPDGNLRLRSLSKGKGVVEVRGPGTENWTWAVYRSRPIEDARSLYEAQLQFHQKARADRFSWGPGDVEFDK